MGSLPQNLNIRNVHELESILSLPISRLRFKPTYILDCETNLSPIFTFGPDL